MNHFLVHRATQATAAIETATTPLQKHFAQEEGLSVMRDLQKQIGDAAAVAEFRKSQPQSVAGVWIEPVQDRPVFMVGPPGTKITEAIVLPDGTKAAPNPQYQIVVPARLVPRMVARGFIRANSVITHLDTGPRDGAFPVA